jgi:Protein of unknown function (DUF2796)
MKRLDCCRLVLALGTAFVLTPADAGKAHEHGVARLDIALAGNSIVVLLDTPLDSIVGFERAPRGDAELAKVAAAEKTLRNAARLFQLDTSAGCTASKVGLKAAVLGWGAAVVSEKDSGHAELAASFEFQCRDASRAGAMQIGLFDEFPALARLNVQVAGPKGQVQAVLRKPANRVKLTR